MSLSRDAFIHSTASDGTVSLEEVVERAIAGRLEVPALADHDTRGVGPAVAAANGDRSMSFRWSR